MQYAASYNLQPMIRPTTFLVFYYAYLLVCVGQSSYGTYLYYNRPGIYVEIFNLIILNFITIASHCMLCVCMAMGSHLAQ